jgi:hypothetical protein
MIQEAKLNEMIGMKSWIVCLLSFIFAGPNVSSGTGGALKKINMKKIFPLIMMLGLLTGFNTLQAQKKGPWKEMQDFHKVMSATFHAAEDGNLQPIKTRSQEMLDKAIAWKKSPVPEGYDKKKVKKQLNKLVAGSKKLHKMVKANAGDKEITDKLTALHDVFHAIVD